MEILVCICTYKRNNSLIDCLKTFERAIIPTSIKIKFLIVDNTINGGAKKTLKYFIKIGSKSLDQKIHRDQIVPFLARR